MRYAMVSDLHANLQAWNAVLLDIRAARVDAIVALGDLVGYGPQPAEVLKSVYANVAHFVLGNHDAVLCGKMPESLFNDNARELIQWTRTRLGANAVRFLRTLPLTLDGGTFRCAHGDFGHPAAFNYIIDPADALPSWRAVPDALLFVGHTHQPGIYLLGHSGTPRRVEAQDFVVEPGKRFLVNVGSVGQPRDGDARASYCLFDADEGSVLWRRIPFDLDAYRQALDRAGLPETGSYFLQHDPRIGTPPLREILSFSPPDAEEDTVRDTIEVQTLKTLKRRVTRWKIAAWLATGLLVTSALVAGGIWRQHATRARRMLGDGAVLMDARQATLDVNLLPLPRMTIPVGEPVPGWDIRLGDARSQSLAVQQDEGTPVFRLISGTSEDALVLTVPPIRAAQAMKFALYGLFRYSEDFAGEFVMVLSLSRLDADGNDETLHRYLVKEPNVARQGGFLEARITSRPLPARTTGIRFSLQGRFTGSVEVRELALVRRQ